MSQTGAPVQRNEPMWYTGRSRVLVTPKGITEGEWLCTTAMTSGRVR